MDQPDPPAVLLDIARAVSSTLDLKELLRLIAQRTATACGADVCSIFLWNPPGDRLVPMMSQTASGQQMDELWEEFKRLGSFSREGTLPIIATIGQRTPIVLNDPSTNPLLPARWVDRFRLKALLSVPLIRHDTAIGTLVLHQITDGKPFTDAQVLLASTIASQVALAIENATLFQATQERLGDSETLLAVSRSVSSTLDLKETLVRVAREAAVAAGADSSGAYLLDPTEEAIRPFASYNLPDWVLEPFLQTSLSLRALPLAQEAFDQRMPVYSSDVPTDPRCEHPAIRSLAFRSCLFAPMVVKERLIGGGILSQELPRIFDKFYQVQVGIQAKARETGLGLSIAKSLVELQGGRIWVKSRIGYGSTFTFTLPRRPLEQSQEATTLADAERLS